MVEAQRSTPLASKLPDWLTGPLNHPARLAFVVMLSGGLIKLFSWAALSYIAVVWLWRAMRWSGRWLAVPALVGLPSLGLLSHVGLQSTVDVYALVIFVLLSAAATVELMERRDGDSPMTLKDGRVERRASSRILGGSEYGIAAAAAGLAATSWFRDGTFIAFGDFFPIIRPDVILQKAAPMWTTLTSGLGGRSLAVSQVPGAYFVGAVQALGGTAVEAQHLLLIGLFVAQALSITFLLRSVWPRAGPIAHVAGALFYCFNLQGLFNIPGTLQILAFALLPLLCGLMLRGLVSGWRGYPLFWAFASSGLGYVGGNLPLVLVAVGGSTVVATSIHLSRGGRARTILHFGVLAAPLSILFNLWWLVPAAYSLVGSAQVRRIPVSPVDWGWTHVRNSLSNLFGLNPHWAWPQRLYFPYSDSYKNVASSIGTYFPAVAAFGALVVHGRRSRTISLLTAIALLLIFVSKGIHEPFDDVGLFLFTKVPGMWVFREPASKLLPLVTLIFALLISAFVDRCGALVGSRRSSLGRRAAAMAGVAIGLVLPLAAWPIMTGAVVADRRPILPKTHVAIPSYWTALANELNDQSQASGALLLLPLSDFYQMPYEWGYYGIDALATSTIERSVISGAELGYIPSSLSAQSAVRRLERAIRRSDDGASRWGLRALGVRYILLRRDIDYSVARRLDRNIVHHADFLGGLRRLLEVKKAGQFGPLTLFEVTGWEPGLISSWPRLHEQGFPQRHEEARLSQPGLPSQANTVRSMEGPPLQVVAESTTRYVVEVRNSRRPFLLTLNQTFDPGWRISAPSGAPLRADHVRVNAYANGWLISNKGSFRVLLEFGPERWARIARTTSLGSMALVLILMLFGRVTTRATRAS